MDRPGALEPVGLGTVEQAVYEALVLRPSSTQAELAEDALLSPAQVRAGLSALEGAGLARRVSGDPRRFVPAPPDVGLEALVVRREQQLEQVRVLARRLTTTFRTSQTAADPSEVVELLNSVDAVVQRFAQLQQEAVDEVLILDSPPYRASETAPVNDAELEALARGVSYRVVYDRAALDAMAPDPLGEIGGYVAAGEQARLIPSLPLKMSIIDRSVAMVPLMTRQHGLERCLVVHPCSLLDALLHTFDSLWCAAHPLQALTASVDAVVDEGSPQQCTPADSQILTMLATGLTDESIAHHLGHSHRTIRRRIAALMDRLGAETRFQAGVAATRRGWI